MLIRITEDCEPCYSDASTEMEDCFLEKDTILEGIVSEVKNWEGKPMDCIDLRSANRLYLAIPNDCWEEKALVPGVTNEQLVKVFQDFYEAYKCGDSSCDANGRYEILSSVETRNIFEELNENHS